MADIFLFVKYNGSWTENHIYKEKDVMGICVPPSLTYAGLIQMLYEELNMTPSSHAISVKYETGGICAPVKIHTDRSLRAYLELKKSEPDKTQFLLCLDICEQPRKNIMVEKSVPKLNDVAGLLIDSSSVGSTSNACDGPNMKENVGPCPIPETRGIEDSVIPSPVLGQIPALEPGLAPSLTSNDTVNHEASPSSSTSIPVSDFKLLGMGSLVEVKRLSFYESKEVLQRHLQMYAINNHFQYKIKVSCKEVLHVVCRNANCKWAVRAVRLRRSQVFQIKRFDAKHTCSTDWRQEEHPQATAKLVGACVKYKFLNRAESECSPKDIIQIMKQEYGVSISYNKALKSKKNALESLYGTDEQSYAFLPTLSYMVNTKNPGSVIDVVTEDQDRFLYYFMSVSASINGWPYCRPVIAVKESLLKAYYQGALFTACAIDANDQTFPLAFGVGKAECNEAWEFFFKKLKESIGDREDLVIISDGRIGVLNAVRKIYPNGKHGFYIDHILGRIKKRFKRLSKDVNWKFYGAAKAYASSEWENFMQQLDEEDSRIRLFLETEFGHDSWSRCFFNSRRFSIMTSDDVEPINVTNKKPREFRISKLIGGLSEKMGDWFYEQREKAAETSTVLSIEAQKRLDASQSLSNEMTVISYSEYEFEVGAKDRERWTVNLAEKTCTCREFQMDQFICSHAIAACRDREFSVYEYISNYYKKENWQASYKGVVYPTGSACHWTIPLEVQQRKVNPPTIKDRAVGRSKKRRILAQDEAEV